jgi:YVTN family beta-propeller protein
MKVAFQGEPGAYSEEAVLNYFGKVDPVPCESFDAVFDAVVSGKCAAALIPIENSLAGSIHQNYDLLLHNDLHIAGEYLLRVRHCLIVQPGVKKKEIRKAISHPQALGQCAGYLKRLKIKAEQTYDTAGSVKILKESGARDTAAIASRRAADLYGMHILEEGIEDNPENFTRFLVIQREAAAPEFEAGAGAKTSIVFSLKNDPGSLFKALSVFALRDIDLTKIESRPLQGRPWEYLFYIDFLGSVHDEKVKRALDNLGEYAIMLRVLGSYPKFMEAEQSEDPTVSDLIHSDMPIEVGGRPRSLAFDGSQLWVACADEVEIVAVDVATMEKSESISVSVPPQAICFDGTRLWLTNSVEGKVIAIDLKKKKEVMSLQVEAFPRSLAFDGQRMWVASGDGNCVEAFDVSSGEHVALIPVGTYPGALTVQGKSLWVANSLDDTVQVIDLDKLTASEPIQVGNNPRSFAFDGKKMWVANLDGHSIQSIDPKTLVASDPIQVGNFPSSLVFDGNVLWIANYSDASVQAFDTKNGINLQMLSVGSDPDALLLDGKRLWVCNSAENTIQYITL